MREEVKQRNVSELEEQLRELSVDESEVEEANRSTKFRAVHLHDGVDLGFSIEEKEVIHRAAFDFEFFCNEIFPLSFVNEPFEFKLNWHHRLWCNDIQNNTRVCLLGPRYSLKSTIGGHANVMWRMLKYTFGLYVSYREDLVGVHLEDIKDRITINPYFRNFDDVALGLAALRYRIGKKKIRILKAGIFTAVRGLHPQFVILDDILPDVSEKMLTPNELRGIEKRYSGAFANLPTKGGSLSMLGTPQDPKDILHVVKKRSAYKWRKLPAEDGFVIDEGEEYAEKIAIELGMQKVTNIEFDGESYKEAFTYKCLWSEYDEAWLREQEEAIGKRAYNREFLLQPASMSETYFRENQIAGCVDSNLHSFTADLPYISNNEEFVVGGMDVGKKQHPSHIAIFKLVGNTLVQLASIYVEDMDYTFQVELVNKLIDDFSINVFLWDNTRSELEDRGLNPEVCRPVVFATRDSLTTDARSKMKMATTFEGFVAHKIIRLLDDDRQKDQIMQVRNDLKSAANEDGHGDAFFSIMLACVAAGDEEPDSSCEIVGEIQTFFEGKTPRGRMSNKWAFNKECEDFREQQERGEINS